MPIAVQPIFPTLIATGQLDNYRKYRADLNKAFEEDKQSGQWITNTVSDKACHSLCPNEKDEDGLNASDGIKNHLNHFISDLTKEISRFAYFNYGIDKSRCDWLCNVAWLNEIENGGFQYKHNHTNSFLSLIYYLDTPPDEAKTRFHRPHCDMRPTMSFEADRYHDGNFEYVIPNMVKDTFIVFPSYLHHEVPIMTTGKDGKPRRTFACNFIPDRIDTSSYILELK
jgi:uncharacterized protein (TIGR02466 family)